MHIWIHLVTKNQGPEVHQSQESWILLPVYPVSVLRNIRNIRILVFPSKTFQDFRFNQHSGTYPRIWKLLSSSVSGFLGQYPRIPGSTILRFLGNLNQNVHGFLSLTISRIPVSQEVTPPPPRGTSKVRQTAQQWGGGGGMIQKVRYCAPDWNQGKQLAMSKYSIKQQDLANAQETWQRSSNK